MQQYKNTVAIQDYLPHREPMLMVDIILELSSTTVKTILEVKADNIFVENGLFSEIGLIENAAQTCSSIVGQSFFLTENNEVKNGVEVIGFISGIKTIKIIALAKVGDEIFTNSTLVSRYDTDDYIICTMKTAAFVGDKLILEAEINLFIQENHNKS